MSMWCVSVRDLVPCFSHYCSVAGHTYAGLSGREEGEDRKTDRMKEKEN